MSYAMFCQKAKDLTASTGSRVIIYREDGKHVARFSDGTVITGNTKTLSVGVRWGSGHVAMAAL